MYFKSATLLALAFGALFNAHFVLEIPTSLGFDDEVENIAPCGSFDPTNRDHVALWPIAGSAVGVLTSHCCRQDPGRTHRRCGEDGFASGKSSCFRSGSGSGSGVRAGA